MTEPLVRRVRWACILAIVALALMIWSLLQPDPLPVIVAMSLGQVIGTASLGLYVLAIIADLRKAHVLEKKDRSVTAENKPG